MPVYMKIKNILHELKQHAPFTVFGAVVGLLCVFAARDASHETSTRLFSIFHPLHVFLSAMVTAALFKINERKQHFLIVLLVGFFGSIGVATLSDSIIPFFGEDILGVSIVTHHHHEHEHTDIPAHLDEQKTLESKTIAKHDVHSELCEDKTVMQRLHLGFIVEWYSVLPAALLGVFVAYFMPRTKSPHAAHVLISTWASSAHILMNTHTALTASMWVGLLAVLFVSVWLPCCVSDIIFPMLFVKNADGCNNTHSCIFHKH